MKNIKKFNTFCESKDEKIIKQEQLDRVVDRIQEIFALYGLSDFFEKQSPGAAVANFDNRKGSFGNYSKIMDDEDLQELKELGKQYDILYDEIGIK